MVGLFFSCERISFKLSERGLDGWRKEKMHPTNLLRANGPGGNCIFIFKKKPEAFVSIPSSNSCSLDRLNSQILSLEWRSKHMRTHTASGVGSKFTTAYRFSHFFCSAHVRSRLPRKTIYDVMVATFTARSAFRAETASSDGDENARDSRSNNRQQDPSIGRVPANNNNALMPGGNAVCTVILPPLPIRRSDHATVYPRSLQARRLRATWHTSRTRGSISPRATPSSFDDADMKQSAVHSDDDDIMSQDSFAGERGEN